MKQCHECGVELDDEVVRCPLCSAPLTDEGVQADSDAAQSVYPETSPHPDQIQVAERRRARFWLWEMFSVVIVASAIIVAATDFGYGFDLSWSVYPLTALAFVWIFVTAVIGLSRDIPLAYSAGTVALLAYLLVLDALVPGEPWFLTFALPVTLLVAVVGGGAAATIRSLKLSAFQALAAAVFFAGIFVVGLEVIFFFALGLESILSWSIVAFGGCLSIALLLWLINKRLRERHADFTRVFHL